MPEDRTLSRVRLCALLLMLGVGAEMLRYIYDSLDRSLKFSFLEPERWNTHRLVDAGAEIAMGPRIGYFAVWGTVILLSVLSFLAALHLLNMVRQGRIFDLRTANAVRRLGLILGIAMVADLAFHALDPWLLTQSNAEPLHVRWGYDPSDIKTLSMAMILFLFGWVMQQSIHVDQENREFV